MAETVNQTAVEEQVQENVQNNNEVVNTKLSYDKIIKNMLANGGKRINNIRVKNVNNTEKDNYTMISFTIDRNIPGNVLQDDGSYKEGMTNVIFTSLYAIAGALKEDEELGWLANTFLENPDALNLILNGATIDIIQQAVEAGEEYYNPFTTKTDSLPQVFDHSTFINNVIKFKLGKTGQRMSELLAIKKMGY